MKVFTTLIAILLTLPSIACDESGKSGFLPENNKQIPVGMKNLSGLTQDSFHKVINEITGLYADEVKSHGATLVVHAWWEDPKVNAAAMRTEGNLWHVLMFGGLARFHAMTEEGFAAVLCHELGHHLGGFPLKKGRWASNEGQSDYWAGSKCLKRYFEGKNNIEEAAKLTLPAIAQAKCQEAFSDIEEQAICLRVAGAGKVVADLFTFLGDAVIPASLETPDTTIVAQTDDTHPGTQCRLDTYFQAGLCSKDINLSMGLNDHAGANCTRAESYDIGVRPRCWFKVPSDI